MNKATHSVHAGESGILARMGGLARRLDVADEADAVERLHVFYRVVALANAALIYGGVAGLDPTSAWQLHIAASPMVWVGAIGVFAGYQRAGMALQALALLWVAIDRFPGLANHMVLQIYIALILTLLPRGQADASWVIGTVRWLLLIVVFGSAAQKLAHGSYWSGSFFGYLIGAESSGKFHWFLERLASADEVQRLRDAVATAAPSDVTPRSLLLVWASRLTLFAELAIPAWMVVRPRDLLPAIALLLSFAGIALLSRELVFGSLVLGMIALGVSARALRWVVGLQLVALVLGTIVRVYFPFTYLN